MKGLRPYSLGVLSRSRMHGTKVTLAGRPAFLPNHDVPIVVQQLTKGQIEAIPKDRFTVSMVSRPGNILFAPSEHGGGAHSDSLGRIVVDLRPKQARLSRNHKFRKAIRSVSSGIEGTELYTAIISMADKIKSNAEGLYIENRQLTRDQVDAPPHDSCLFFPPIDDGRMADCIMQAIIHFFGEEDTCKIMGRKYNLPAFCLLMHGYFIRIGILRNVTRTPFCKYLQEYVLKAWRATFTSRTFTNYANEYNKVELEFTRQDKLEIDFSVLPKQDSKHLQNAFHEVGHYFHTSQYFEDLRAIRDYLAKFKI